MDLLPLAEREEFVMPVKLPEQRAETALRLLAALLQAIGILHRLVIVKQQRVLALLPHVLHKREALEEELEVDQSVEDAEIALKEAHEFSRAGLEVEDVRANILHVHPVAQ